jgi:hypothetical protein
MFDNRDSGSGGVAMGSGEVGAGKLEVGQSPRAKTRSERSRLFPCGFPTALHSSAHPYFATVLTWRYEDLRRTQTLPNCRAHPFYRLCFVSACPWSRSIASYCVSQVLRGFRTLEALHRRQRRVRS